MARSIHSGAGVVLSLLLAACGALPDSGLELEATAESTGALEQAYKHKDKHGDKHKDKDKHGDKNKNKDKHGDKHKDEDKHGGKHKAPDCDESLELEGDLRTHDPSLTRHGKKGDYYVFSTGDPAVNGGTIQIRRSPNLRQWSFAGTVFNAIPAWVREKVPGVENLWAPEIYEHRGTYYLYYSGSTFGSNRSVIGLATNKTLDPKSPQYEWVDQGLVFESTPANDFNAIDPAVVEDSTGTPWLAFGSFWSGIRMVQLEWPSGKVVANPGEPLRLADRFVPPNAIEAPYIVERKGWYYLFVSLDFCCRGTGSTYKIAVGRSRNATGPFFDRLGTPLQHGGGTVILSERDNMFGPGGQSVFEDYLVYHWYDANANGDFRLGIRRIDWESGWPSVAELD